MKYRRLGRTGLRVGGWDRDLAAQRRVGTALYPARGGSAAGTSTSTGPWREPPRHRRVLWGPPDRSAHRRRLRGQAPQRRGGGGHAAQEKGAEWPFLPLLSNCSPNASTREAVARAIVRVELAGWNMPVSFSTSPSGFKGGTKSSTSMSTASPILTRWRRPSSL